MVRRSDDEARSGEVVKQLQEHRYDPLQLPVLALVRAFLSQRIELVKEHHPVLTPAEVEHRRHVARGLAEKRRHDHWKLHASERQAELACNRLSGRGLAGARRPDEQQLAAWRQSMG